MNASPIVYTPEPQTHPVSEALLPFYPAWAEWARMLDEYAARRRARLQAMQDNRPLQ